MKRPSSSDCFTNRGPAPWFRVRRAGSVIAAATGFHSVGLPQALLKPGSCVAPIGLRKIRFRIGAHALRPSIAQAGATTRAAERRRSGSGEDDMRGLVRRSRIGRWSAAAMLPAWLVAGARAGRRWRLSSGSCRRSAAAEARLRRPRRLRRSAEPERPLTVRPFRKKRAARAALAACQRARQDRAGFDLRGSDAANRRCRHDQGRHEGLLGRAYSPDRPYGDDDFVAVSASKSVTPGLKKTLIELNKLPPHG